jgi:nitrite reductase/ring-hydroxylating ferredoxin subunit
MVLTSTGAFVSVNRPSRVVPSSTTLSAKESQVFRDNSSPSEKSSLVQKFFPSSSEKETPVVKQEKESNGWPFNFFRRNKGSEPEKASSQTKKRSSDGKRTEENNNKKRQPSETKASKDKSSSREKKEEKKKRQGKDAKQLQKEEVAESKSFPIRSFVSGLFAGDDTASGQTGKKEAKASKQQQKEEKKEGTPNRNFVSGLFAKDDDTSKIKNEDSDKNIISAFSSVQRFFGGTFFDNNKNGNQEQWVPVFPKTRLSPGEIVPATIGGIDLLVIASKDGRKLYCIANSCSHLGTPLETGKIVRLPVEGPVDKVDSSRRPTLTETEVSAILQQDGLEDCIVCPLHRTAFALKSGEVRGEWCPYPPLVGKLVGTVKQPTGVATFDIRTKGKQIEVRINSLLDERDEKWTNS